MSDCLETCVILSDVAAPIIDSVEVEYPAGRTNLLPGQSAIVTITAHDPDNQVVTVTVTIEDAGRSGSASVPVEIIDPVTFTASAASGTLTQPEPGVFIYTAA